MKNVCLLSSCQGNDTPKPLFHGICYRCLHADGIEQTTSVQGYDVKVWHVTNPDGTRATVALVGRISDGQWGAIAGALPRSHMDENEAIADAIWYLENANDKALHGGGKSDLESFLVANLLGEIMFPPAPSSDWADAPKREGKNAR